MLTWVLEYSKAWVELGSLDHALTKSIHTVTSMTTTFDLLTVRDQAKIYILFKIKSSGK